MIHKQSRTKMATVEERFQSLLEQHFRITDPDPMNSTLSDLGVNSLDSVAFLRAVCKEFGIEFRPEDAANFKNLQEAVDKIKADIN